MRGIGQGQTNRPWLELQGRGRRGKPYRPSPSYIPDAHAIRYEEGDPDAIRQEYLGLLATVCNLRPKDIDGRDYDGLTWRDFMGFVAFCDSWLQTKTELAGKGIPW